MILTSFAIKPTQLGFPAPLHYSVVKLLVLNASGIVYPNEKVVKHLYAIARLTGEEQSVTLELENTYAPLKDSF